MRCLGSVVLCVLTSVVYSQAVSAGHISKDVRKAAALFTKLELKLCVGALLTQKHIVAPLSPLADFIDGLEVRGVQVSLAILDPKPHNGIQISRIDYNRKIFNQSPRKLDFQFAIATIRENGNDANHGKGIAVSISDFHSKESVAVIVLDQDMNVVEKDYPKFVIEDMRDIVTLQSESLYEIHSALIFKQQRVVGLGVTEGGKIHFINLKEQFLPLRNWLKKNSSESSMNSDWFTSGAPTNSKVDLLWNGDDDENFIHGR